MRYGHVLAGLIVLEVVVTGIGHVVGVHVHVVADVAKPRARARPWFVLVVVVARHSKRAHLDCVIKSCFRVYRVHVHVSRSPISFGRSCGRSVSDTVMVSDT